MKRADQDKVARHLIERGLLDETDLPASDSAESEEILDLLAFLVHRGLVDEAAVRDAAEALGLVAEPPTETGPVSAALLTETDLAGEDADPAPISVPPELRKWDRYRVIRKLGRGGSGTVYEAEDPKLGRRVAIKVLAHAERGALREARAQARLSMRGVCPVYEVGWIGGLPYLVMQLVDGETLHRAARTMTREEIVCAVRDAARAVHGAHAAGLVHRDIKPSNLMIERTAEGETRCYVLDFGLAREVSAEGATRPGAPLSTAPVVGTPGFMAPEQARGEVRQIDRRTDVYGLGATLYDALAGEPPFTGSSVSVLTAVLSEDPKRLADKAQGIATDLDTIVMKCLEKDPSRRYESARALADDLESHLRGEPISARPRSLANKVFGRIRRHPALSAAIGLGVAAATILGSGWAITRRAAAREAEEIREIERGAADIEAAARGLALLPLHDTRAERERLSGQMRELEGRIPRGAGRVRTAGHAAVGRAAWSLGLIEDAKSHLDAAWAGWESGEDTPFPLLRSETAFARAQVYTTYYAEGLRSAKAIPVPEVHARALADLETSFRRPAKTSLALVSEGPHKEVVQGWIAYHEGEYEQAISRAEAIVREKSWDEEAHFLAGSAHAAVGNLEEAAGHFEVALGRFERAADAFERAALVARSRADRHLAECRARSWALGVRVDSLLEKVAPERFDRALDACDRASTADPGSPDPIEEKAQILYMRGVGAFAGGGSGTADLEEARSLAEAVTTLHPERAFAHATLGGVLGRLAEQARREGEDSGPFLWAAIDASEAATSMAPDLLMAQNNLGVLCRSAAEDATVRGEDPRPWLDRAMACYERARVLDPSFLGIWNNIGRAAALKAEYELRHGLDASASLAEAARAYEKAASLLPDLPIVHNNLGALRALEAVAAIVAGRDAAPAMALGHAALDRALSLQPSYAYALKNKGDLALLAARIALGTGADSAPLLMNAQEAYDRALQSKPGYPGALRGLSAVHRLRALDHALAPADKAQQIASAEEALRRAQSAAPGDPDTDRAFAALRALDSALRSGAPEADLTSLLRADPLTFWPFQAKP